MIQHNIFINRIQIVNLLHPLMCKRKYVNYRPNKNSYSHITA